MGEQALNRFSHSILSVSDRLHSAVHGTGDGINEDEMRALAYWLEYRLLEGWEVSVLKETSRYDEAIRELGFAALAEARRYLEDL